MERGGDELGAFKNPTNNGGVMTFSYEKIRTLRGGGGTFGGNFSPSELRA